MRKIVQNCIINIKRNYISTIITVSFPFYVLLIFSPIEIYYTNNTDFNFKVLDFLPIYSLFFFSLTLICSLLLSFTNKYINKILRIIVLSVSITAYVQNLFWNKGIFEKGGGVIDWDKSRKAMYINSFCWILFVFAFFIIIFILSNNNKKIITFISSFFLLLHIISTISLIPGLVKISKEDSWYRLSNANQFHLAPNNNIIVLVIDKVGENFFEGVQQDNPDMLSNYKDFTLYNNYDSCYKPTFPSISHMFTGDNPDCSVTRLDWMKKAWNGDKCVSFYDTLHSKDYTCNFYILDQRYVFGNPDNLKGKVDNLIPVTPKVNKPLMTSMLTKYSIYRYAPTCLKPKFEVNQAHYKDVVYYNEQTDLSYYAYDYAENIRNKGLSINDNWNNLFVYQHLDGVHEPWQTDRLGSYKEESTKEEALLGNFYVIDEYINQLKELGLYDSSTIIIMSDHGDDDLQAIFMVKQAGENHDKIIINSSPISADDFIPTILSLIDEDYQEFGYTIWDWNEDSERERTLLILDDGLKGYSYIGTGEELNSKKTYDIELEDVKSDW